MAERQTRLPEDQNWRIAQREMIHNIIRKLSIFGIGVMVVSLLRKIMRAYAGESLRTEIIDEVMLLVFLVHLYLWHSQNARVAAVYQNRLVLIFSFIYLWFWQWWSGAM